MKKNSLITAAVCAALAFGGVIFAQAPVVNIGTKHGNLRAAQEHIVQAYQKIDAAQADNHEQLGGHAEKAKGFLEQADAELRQAASYADAHGR
jgi:hypothetical protein